MSGADILYWLENIWDDVIHLGTADIPSLIFRLLVLLAAIVIGQKLLFAVLHILWDIVRPVVRFVRDVLAWVWWIISAPVRVPRAWARKLAQAQRDRENARRWEAERRQQEQAEQERIAAEVRAQRAEYERMKGVMSGLE